VLEGFHAVKHALRFGAQIDHVAATSAAELNKLTNTLAPDLRGRFEQLVEAIDESLFATVAAIARRPAVDPAAALRERQDAPVVLLENPRNLGNMGACVRVAAAADIAAVLTTGTHDPWHADVVRAAAGLHFALPVARVDELPPTDRPLIAVDPAGAPLDHPAQIPPNAVLAFGGERHGLSDSLLHRAAARVSLPMRTGVSSLNLATSVAGVLYGWRMAAG
jgi:TrmH family RNA methyltransferase